MDTIKLAEFLYKDAQARYAQAVNLYAKAMGKQMKMQTQIQQGQQSQQKPTQSTSQLKEN